jgi:hypothetical protein
VPDAAARLRFFVNVGHTDAHIDEAVAILAQETGHQPATTGDHRDRTGSLRNM